MGWLFTQGASKADIIARQLGEHTHYFTVAHSVVGNHLWAVFENRREMPEGSKRFLALFLLAAHRNYGWGYKDIEESMGPCETDCPLYLLDLVPDPGGYATAWRERVREHHKAKAAKSSLKKSIKVGDTLKLKPGCKPAEVKVSRIIGAKVYGYANYVEYRVSPRHIDSVVTPEVTRG